MISLQVEGDDLQLSPDCATSVSLVVSELITNALEHAFPGRDRGRVVVRSAGGGFAAPCPWRTTAWASGRRMCAGGAWAWGSFGPPWREAPRTAPGGYRAPGDSCFFRYSKRHIADTTPQQGGGFWQHGQGDGSIALAFTFFRAFQRLGEGGGPWRISSAWGIDIGTSTTQVVFSRLTMENAAGYFAVPRVSIVDKQVIYKGQVHTTPLKSPVLIDGAGVREIVAREYGRAGFRPADVETGAVIITGESARKENAAAVLSELSGFAGDFVVSTAGRTWSPSSPERAPAPGGAVWRRTAWR